MLTTPFGVLADDLTGSCDTGVAFSARGSRLLVLTRPDAEPPPGMAWQGVVLNTDSRHVEPPQAEQRVTDAFQRLTAGGWPVRYKKIDSTLRGPLVAELRPLLACGAALVIAPAFPAAGRTVEDGVLHVNGRPVHATEFGRDRHNPARESHLPTLLEPLGAPQARLTLADLERGGHAATTRLAALQREGARVIVTDATRPEHLDALATAVLAAWGARDGSGTIAVGSAGLATALAARMFPGPRVPAAPEGFPRPGPVLVVTGSQAQATRLQREGLFKAGAYGLMLAPEVVDADDWDARAPAWLAERCAELAAAAHTGATVLVLHVAQSPALESPQSEGERFRRRSQRLNPALGALAAMLAAEVALSGVVLTGGDTAGAVLGALEAAALQVGPEVLPGIALSWPVDGARPGLPLVTKAGGFGADDALNRAVHFLQHGVPAS